MRLLLRALHDSLSAIAFAVLDLPASLKLDLLSKLIESFAIHTYMRAHRLLLNARKLSVGDFHASFSLKELFKKSKICQNLRADDKKALSEQVIGDIGEIRYFRSTEIKE